MPQFSRREKVTLAAIFVACTLPLGLVIVFRALEADPNIQLPAQTSPPSTNGFDLYLQAAKNTAQPTPPVDPTSDVQSASISAAQGAARYGLSRRQAWHQGAAKGWTLLEQAKKADSRHPIQTNENLFPAYAELRQLARDKWAEANLFRMRGQNGRAVESALDTIEMGFDVSRGGPLVSRLVTGALVAIGIASINDTDRIPEKLSAREARAAMQRLEKLIENKPSWAQAIEDDRWWTLGELQREFQRGNWREQNSAPLAVAPGEKDDWNTSLRRRFTSRRTVVTNVNRLYDRAVENAKKPYSTTPVSPPSGLDPYTQDLWIFDRMRFNAARENTQLDLLLLRLALQTFKQENGRYPAQLDELKGRYLKRIPNDDFNGGNAYRYTLKNGKYRLWSVGPDGLDDGGKAIPFKVKPSSPILPWHSRNLPSVLDDSLGDVVAGENR